MNQSVGNKKIKRALISIYHKDGIDDILRELNRLSVEIVSTGGTYDYIEKMGIPVTAVEDVTGYPSIFGGRVKTLHPNIFGGILFRRDHSEDLTESDKYEISGIDLVIVDLYPFEEYVSAKAEHSEIIEKIDIGGISLIRAAAKNYRDVLIVPSCDGYNKLLDILKDQDGESTLSQREWFAAFAFQTSSNYDTAIFGYMNREAGIPSFSHNITESKPLRYGENPHQSATYFGNDSTLPRQIHGKEISYNNLLDIEAAIELMNDFEDPTIAIIKHNNACGCATRDTILQAWIDALACDPVSAFGGIIISNREVDIPSAQQINNLFFEIIIAPSYQAQALDILKEKKNRIILINSGITPSGSKFRSLLGGALVQQRDEVVETPAELETVTKIEPTPKEIEDLIFANTLVKHSKSNAIVLAKNRTLLASGIGQTSRVDALRQAIEKAGNFNHDLKDSVMASDAFFPFADCVEIAHHAGIRSVIHPGGSLRDRDSIDYCDQNNMAMVITGKRHFKH